MNTLTYDPNLYALQKKEKHSDFEDQLETASDKKEESDICRFWGCYESSQHVDHNNRLCRFHDTILTNVFIAKFQSFVMEESDMFKKIKDFISNNPGLTKHMMMLFNETSKNVVIINEKVKYGVTDNIDETIYLVDNVENLFMSYIKNHYEWLLTPESFTKMLLEMDREDVEDLILGMTTFEDDEQTHITFYVNSIDKINMIELICHHIAYDIHGKYSPVTIKVE